MTFSLSAFKRFMLGAPLDPFRSETRRHMALVTFFAWIGLGADGLSSANYGPEEAFIALGDHTQLAIFLAFATGITVFLIGAAYMQIIELFPGGGGGYKVASTLLGPRFGLVAGSALLIDYILTIAISIASGTDALFSLFPIEMQPYKIWLEYLVVMLLAYLNLRGMKESIRFLMPIFLGFLVTHGFLILYGITVHANGLGDLVPEAVAETQETSMAMGWLPLLALFFKAFSLGGGTYTGLEAVSNSVQNLAEPRVKTGKATMWCVAFSLAFMATGVIMLYLLWDVERIPGETLNASVFQKITEGWTISGFDVSGTIVAVAMICASGLLYVAANTGFLAGPAVLANMAIDRWMPNLFSLLSSRLVTKNGVLLMAFSAIAALFVTQGAVSMLVVLYSINVFLTFTLSLAGLTRYRWRERMRISTWPKMLVSVLSLIVCAFILTVTLIEKFASGGWLTVLVTSVVITIGLLIQRHYQHVQQRVDDMEAILTDAMRCDKARANVEPPAINKNDPTAIFLISGASAAGIHTFLWVQRIFPKAFKNFLFVSVGEIDTWEFSDSMRWTKMRRDMKKMLKNYVEFCRHRGLPSDYYVAYGTDAIKELTILTDRLAKEFPNAVFFATRLMFSNENIFIQMLHNQTSYLLQRRLHQKGKTMIILPMNL